MLWSAGCGGVEMKMADPTIRPTRNIQRLTALAYLSLAMMVVGGCGAVAAVLVSNDRAAVISVIWFAIGFVALLRIREIANG